MLSCCLNNQKAISFDYKQEFENLSFENSFSTLIECIYKYLFQLQCISDLLHFQTKVVLIQG